ncbi:hypothetical protein N183_29760 [Sinorhizobium sp. Sb3]|nr:hypothetical protein N183_29760 [Sinorhizobium sp. Sb3]
MAMKAHCRSRCVFALLSGVALTVMIVVVVVMPMIMVMVMAGAHMRCFPFQRLASIDRMQTITQLSDFADDRCREIILIGKFYRHRAADTETETSSTPDSLRTAVSILVAQDAQSMPSTR